MSRRRSRRWGREYGGGRGQRRVSNPLIIVAVLLFAVGLLGTVIHVPSLVVPPDVAVWSLICSNLLLLVGAFSREM